MNDDAAFIRLSILYAILLTCTLWFGLMWIVGIKRLKRIFSPCQECHFIPSAVTRQDRTTGAWHQIQECERCGRKRDAVLSQSTLEAARKFFIGQQP